MSAVSVSTTRPTRTCPTRRSRARALTRRVVAGLTLALLPTACGGGASDVVGGSGPADADTSITLVAYAVPEPGWSKVIPAFNDTERGRNVEVVTSYGASGDQSRAVASGKPADIVNFSVEPDITRLVEAGKVAADWNADVTKGIPFGSVVTLVVRSGNPKNIRDWSDLLQPGVEVITPSPLSSGSAKWNLLAPYAAHSDGGADHQAGLDFIDKLVSDHVKMRPGSGREATDVFLHGSGDVLISYENEALTIEGRGEPVEHITPPQTFKIENPLALVTSRVASSAERDVAVAFKNFQYTADAQRLWAEAGFRPVDPAIVAEFAEKFPAPQKLWTIADLGGWDSVDPQFFDKDGGAITKIYTRATG